MSRHSHRKRLVLAAAIVAAAILAWPEIARADMGPGPIEVLGSDIAFDSVVKAWLAALAVGLAILAWVMLRRAATAARVSRAVVRAGGEAPTNKASELPAEPTDDGGE